MKKLDVRLLRMIRHSKGQFISVTVIIWVALCIFMLFSVTSVNIKDAVNSYYKLTNVNDIQVQLIKIPQSAVTELLSIEGIKDVQGRVSFDVPLRVSDKDEKVNIRIITIPDSGDRINKLYKISGQRAKLGSSDAFLLQQFATARDITAGDTITPYINGRTYTLKISGVAANPEFVYLMENEQSLMPANDKFGVAYVSEAFGQSISGYKGSYNELLITLKDKGRADDIIDHLEDVLDKYGVKRIIKLEDQLSNNVLVQKMDGIDQMTAIIPVLFLMVAAIVITIMLSRIVNNDRSAIGVLKAMGYGNMSILSHYTKYSLAVGLIGSITGILSGILLSGPLTKVFLTYFNVPMMKPSVYYADIYKGILLTGIFCTASGLLGARSVLSIMPADSMRPLSPKAGKRILLERVGFLWKKLSFSWKMVIRNIMRTKRRALFLVIGLAMAYAINTVPLYEGSAIPIMFEKQYGQYMKMDYTMEFLHPINKSVLIDINNLVAADRLEPKLEYPFEVVNGWRKKTISLIGAPRDTEFYEFRDADDNLLTLPEDGILLSEALSKTLHVKKGDFITVKNFMPGKDDVVLKVGGVVKQYLGINAYMDIETMQKTLMEKEMITGASLTSHDNVKEKLKDIKNISLLRSVTDMKDAFLEFLDTMILATRLYLLFGGILGFAIIYNATIISLSERNLELASLRIMGFHKKDIYFMILKENCLITAFGILLGIPLGMAMIQGMAASFSSEMITLPILMPPSIFITAAAATVLFMIAAQLAALKKIYGLNFIDALKNRIS